MNRWWIAPLVVASLALTFTVPAQAVKPQPAPTIVALEGNRAIASDGTVYEITVANATCGPSLAAASVFGRFFTGPPVSPITSAWQTGIGLMISLANGDLWIMNESCCTPCYKTGTYMGNVFSVAGTAAVPANAVGEIDELSRSRIAPNPTSGSSRIEYGTPEPGPVDVRIFDVSGRLVRNIRTEHAAAGKYSVAWDGVKDSGGAVANGIYFAKVTVPDGSETSCRVVVAR